MIRIKNIVEDGKFIERRFVKTNYKQSRPPGHSPRLPNNGEPQELTDTRFMSAAQKRAHKEGIKIWV